MTQGNNRKYTVDFTDVTRKLFRLEKSFRIKVFKAATRAGCNVLRKECIANAPKGKTGLLKKAIKTVAYKRNRRGRVGCHVQIGKKFFTGSSYYGAFVEFGVAGRKPKEGFKSKSKNSGFIQKAIKSKKKAATDAAKNKILAALKTGVKKIASSKTK